MTQKDNATRAHVEASSHQAGQRIDRVLAEALTELSRSRLKGLIADGHVTRNGETVRQPALKVAAGDRFEVTVPAAIPATPQAQSIPLDILYEDAELIVIDKPAGLVVHPAPGNPDRTLVNALIAHCGDGLTGIGGVRRPGIVHRLDKDTSGVMVAAKTAAAHESLVAQFSARTVSRAYRALVWGRPVPPEGRIEGAIGRNPRNRKKMAVVARGGKPAATRYRTMRVYGTDIASLIECRLETGRTHQIRVHLSHIGHAILGDPAYGRAAGQRRVLTARNAAAAEAVARFPRQALHAFNLGVVHPKTSQPIEFETEFPQDMAALVNNLEFI